MLGQMGYGLQARGQDIQGLLGGRGQDIQQLLGLGGLELQGRGQDLQSRLGAMSGLTGIGGQDIGRMGGVMDMLAMLGGRRRGIQDARYGAEFDEMMRRYGMARMPYELGAGQLPAMGGSVTESRQSGGK
jgi:hypothetical protein